MCMFVLTSLSCSNRTPNTTVGDESGIPEHTVSTIGQLSEFQTGNERIMDDLEQVQLFFKVNGIAKGELVLVLSLTAMWGEMYSLLRNLLAPQKPNEKRFQELSVILWEHFEPKLVVIAA